MQTTVVLAKMQSRWPSDTSLDLLSIADEVEPEQFDFETPWAFAKAMLVPGAKAFVAEDVVEREDHEHDCMKIERLESPQMIHPRPPATRVATERNAIDDLDGVKTSGPKFSERQCQDSACDELCSWQCKVLQDR